MELLYSQAGLMYNRQCVLCKLGESRTPEVMLNLVIYQDFMAFVIWRQNFGLNTSGV